MLLEITKVDIGTTVKAAAGLGVVQRLIGDDRAFVKFVAPTEEGDTEDILLLEDLELVEKNQASAQHPEGTPPVSQPPIVDPRRNTFFAKIALPLARMGLRTFPLQEKDKNPVLGFDEHQKRCSKDENQILAWAAQYPNSNVGVHAIQEEGGVLFIDDDKGDLRARYEKETGRKPPITLTVQSRPGREHAYFLQTDKTRALSKNLTEKDTNSFSLRVKNYYCVGIGSIHPITGLPYTVSVDSPIIPMPDDYLEWLLKQKSQAASTQGSPLQEGQKYPHGQIHNAMVSQARKLLSADFRGDKLENELLEWVHEHCEAPIDESKVIACAKSIEGLYGEEAAKTKNDYATVGGAIVGDPISQTGASQVLTPVSSDEIKAQAVVEAKAAMKERVDEYEEVVRRSEVEAEKDPNPYPYDAWNDTPYLAFAELACKNNYIPPEYPINALMTVVGAICGHRISPEFNPKMGSRFYTVLLSRRGGIGKGDVFTWALDVPTGTGLLFRNGSRSPFNNIGSFYQDFGSARGLLNKFMEQPTILQVYEELSTPVEKFGIAGSGSSFKDLNLNLYDNTAPNWNAIANTKIPADAPTAIHNSILASTTTERWDSMFASVNDETFRQRINLVPSDETRTVAYLVYPDVSGIRNSMKPRIGLLESHRLVWSFDAEAQRMLDLWHQTIAERSSADSDAAEVYGRIQVFLMRVIGHLALWLADPPVPITKGELYPDNDLDGVWVKAENKEDKIWKVVISPDILQKAIRIAEHQIKARKDNEPAQGRKDISICENLIKKWVVKLRSVRWIDLVQKASLRKFGYDDRTKALFNVEKEGFIHIKKNPEDESKQRAWFVVWIGDGRKTKKWDETRGGRRDGAGRKPAKDETDAKQ